MTPEEQGTLDRLSLGWQRAAPLPWLGQPVLRRFWGRADGILKLCCVLLPAAFSSSLPSTALLWVPPGLCSRGGLEAP